MTKNKTASIWLWILIILILAAIAVGVYFVFFRQFCVGAGCGANIVSSIPQPPALPA